MQSYVCLYLCGDLNVEVFLNPVSVVLLKGGFLLKSKLADLTFPKKLPVSTFRMF